MCLFSNESTSLITLSDWLSKGRVTNKLVITLFDIMDIIVPVIFYFNITRIFFYSEDVAI